MTRSQGVLMPAVLALMLAACDVAPPAGTQAAAGAQPAVPGPPATAAPEATGASAPGSDPAVDPVFAEQGAQAQQALATPLGAAYDELVGKYLIALPDYATSVRACIAASPGQQTVHGFLDFDEAGAYRVQLRPAGAFADCLARYLEGRDLPKPPRLPYRNPLTFATQ